MPRFQAMAFQHHLVAMAVGLLMGVAAIVTIAWWINRIVVPDIYAESHPQDDAERATRHMGCRISLGHRDA